MSTLPRRQQGILLTVALAVVGVVVGGLLLFTSSKASEVNLTSASLVPEDAAIYFGFNTDLSSSQWVAAFKLAKRLGAKDPEAELKDSATIADLDWESEVAPFLGGDAAFYFKSINIFAGDFEGGVILKAKKPARALEVLVQQAPADFKKKAYSGVDYIADEDGAMFAALLGDHLAVATSERSLKEIIDVSKGKKGSLGAKQAFREIKDDISKNFLGLWYIDSASLFEGSLFDEPEFRKALGNTTGDSFTNNPVGGAITAADAGFAFQAAAKSEGKSSWPGLQPRTSKFAALVPANTMVFVSTTGLAQAWAEASTGENRKTLDEALRSSDLGPRSVTEAMRDAGGAVGLKSIEELITLLSGETALAAWSRGPGKSEDADGLLIADVRDEAEARSVLDKMVAASAKGKPSKQTIAGKEVTVWVDSTAKDAEPAAYIVTDGRLLLGTVAGVKAVLEGPKENLAGSKVYQHSLKAIPTSLASFIFVNMQEALTAEGEIIPGQFDAATANLEGLVITLVEEKGLTRLAGALSVKE